MEHLIRRAEPDGISVNQDDPVFKSVGLILAITSGVFIGSSFVFKKKGLLQQAEPDGHRYLSSGLWWTGMILMIIGEICNFVAYAFTQAILVTPLGALSVVISTILSSIFLKERLTFQGKVGCAQCIIGAIIIVLHAPNQHTATNIEEFKKMFFAPVFLTYAILAIVGSLIIIWKVAPKYGSRHMLVYIGICSLIGSLSVVTTQGLGTAILKTIQGENQFTHWFLYVLTAFVVITLLTEINYLNKALNLFNTAMVTPVYYVTFTSLTIISSAILTQGFEAPPKSVITVVMGFLVICSGIVLLQFSKATGLDGAASPTDKPFSDNRLSGADYEPGASEIRASFGSIRRYSRDPTKLNTVLPHTMPPSNKESDNDIGAHRRVQSLNFGSYRKNGNGLATINESNSNIARNATTKSLTNPRIEPMIPTDEKNDQSRTSTVKFFSSPPQSLFSSSSSSLPSTDDQSHNQNNDNHNNKDDNKNNRTQRSHPIIHTTSPSKDYDKENDGYFISPSSSPLQHPISYIKQHLSPTNSVFLDNDGPINSEIYSGTVRTDLRRESSSSSNRRSQNSIKIVDRLRRSVSGGSESYDNEGLVTSIT